jgi:hypothetical protein
MPAGQPWEIQKEMRRKWYHNTEIFFMTHHALPAELIKARSAKQPLHGPPPRPVTIQLERPSHTTAIQPISIAKQGRWQPGRGTFGRERYQT